MSGGGGASSSKQKIESLKPSDPPLFKRRRGVFHKDLDGENEIQEVKMGLDKTFTIKDLGHMRYFLGLEVDRNETGIILNQRKYILDILKDLHIEFFSQDFIPYAKRIKLSIDQGDLMGVDGFGEMEEGKGRIPLPETVALVEDIVVEYVTDLVHKAQDVASRRGKRMTEDYLFLVRKDLPKLNRSTELLAMNEELKQARKAFDMDDEKLVNAD
ncbi:hypothetical protein KSS87_002365 [Heliosperma pusillum]|nr:hypothetical protein KSS87_002365 [Heliosperma pusillum]